MGLCIVGGGSIFKAYAAVAAFTVAWTHSVEKIEWREDWRVAGTRLALVEAHIHGDGAGMEAPADARFDASGWHWHPRVEPLASLTLRRSGAVADWRLCIEGICRALDTIVPVGADPVVLLACDGQGEDSTQARKSEGENSAR